MIPYITIILMLLISIISLGIIILLDKLNKLINIDDDSDDEYEDFNYKIKNKINTKSFYKKKKRLSVIFEENDEHIIDILDSLNDDFVIVEDNGEIKSL